MCCDTFQDTLETSTERRGFQIMMKEDNDDDELRTDAILQTHQQPNYYYKIT